MSIVDLDAVIFHENVPGLMADLESLIHSEKAIRYVHYQN